MNAVFYSPLLPVPVLLKALLHTLKLVSGYLVLDAAFAFASLFGLQADAAYLSVPESYIYFQGLSCFHPFLCIIFFYKKEQPPCSVAALVILYIFLCIKYNMKKAEKNGHLYKST